MKKASHIGLHSGQVVAMLTAIISVPFIIAIVMLLQQRMAVEQQYQSAGENLRLFEQGMTVMAPLGDMRDLAAAAIHTQHPEIVTRFNLSEARAASQLQRFMAQARQRDVPGLNDQVSLLAEAWRTLTVKTGIPLEDVIGPYDNVNSINERMSSALSSALFVSELSGGQEIGPSEVLSLPLNSFREARQSIGIIRALALYVSLRAGYLADNEARRMENAWKQLGHSLTLIDSEVKALVARTGTSRLQQQWQLVRTELEGFMEWAESDLILALRVELDWQDAYERGQHAMRSLNGLSAMLLQLADQLQQAARDKQIRRSNLQLLGVALLYAMMLTLSIMLYQYNSRAIRARAESRAKDQFLARMSHEIRTPLNGVIGLAELLRETDPSPRQQEYIGLIESAGRTLNTLVNDVLDYSKIEAGKLDLVNEPFDLPELMLECAQMFNLPASDNGSLVLLDVSEDCPATVSGDAIRLRQVLINLIGNAVKFTRQGRVVVSLHCLRSEGLPPLLTFVVSDTGIGISQEAQSRLFERFSQASADTARHFGGTGLGLSITRELVALMGGEVSVKSATGKGARFSFSLELPVIKDAVPLVRAPASPAVLWDYQGNLADWLCADPRFSAVKCIGAKGDLPVDAGRQASLQLLINGLPPAALLQARLTLLREHNPQLQVAVLAGMRADKPQELGSDVALLRRSVLTVQELQQLFSRASRIVPPVLTGLRLPARLGQLRVLVAEDNPVNQLVTRGYLERLGVTNVEVAADGAQALACYKQQQGGIDLVLMDLDMPVMDGFKCASEIRLLAQRQGWQHCHILALSAHAVAEQARAIRAAGMSGQLVKPLSLSALQKAISGLVGAAD